LLPLYRAITTVTIANGKTTSFWHDVWDADDSLAERFPELFTHCKNQELTVAQAYQGDLQGSLTAHRSNVSVAQLAQVLEIMELHTFTEGKDRRLSMMLKKNDELDSSLLYNALKAAHSSPDAWTKFTWQNKAPPRVKFFAWLLSQGRIQCKTVLMKKGVVDNRPLRTSYLNVPMQGSFGEHSEYRPTHIGLSKQSKSSNHQTTFQQNISQLSYFFVVGIFGNGETVPPLGRKELR
jgi:hypothetical protein